MKRFLMILALGGAMFAGCGDDDGDDDDDVGSDAGDGGTRPDGSVGDAGMDAARPDAGPDGGGLVCGTQICTSFTNGTGTTFAPLCVKNAANQDVCGLSTEPLGGTAAGYPAALERNAPGVASPTCGAFYDSLESPDAGTRGNGRINSTVMVGTTTVLPISYPGCCTAKGFCSGDTNMAKVVFGGAEMDTNANFGCMESTAFFRTAPAAVRMIPCNVTTGVIIPAAPADAGVDGGSRVADAGGMDSGL